MRTELVERTQPPGAQVKQVIVGAMRAYMVRVPAQISDESYAEVGIEFESNISTDTATYFVVENWRFRRSATAVSKPPGAQKTFPCPNCGAPWQSADTKTQRCSSCNQIVDNGRFDWVLCDIAHISADQRKPTLTKEVPEHGTDLPTMSAQNIGERISTLKADDPAFNLDDLEGRVKTIFHDVGVAWSKNELTGVRGLVSDSMYDYLDYWVQAYKQQGLRNVMENSRITKTEVAKVVRDRYYDAVTIRLWATGLDYVIADRSGKVVRGSKRRERPYSEYWTLIRSAERKGPAKSDRSCGNCGAPLDVTMAGTCEHCGAHVTAGEFDWVLSKIEQDDSYRG
jgi:hypothetical protein